MPLGLAVALGMVWAAIREGPATPWGRSLIETLADSQRVGDLGWLRLSGLQGDPWTDFTVDHIEIRDRRGAWVTARRVAVRWRPLALVYRRRIQIEALSASAVTFSRQPILLASPPGPGGASPVSLRIDRLAADVEMSEAFALRQGAYRLVAALDVERRKTLTGRIDAAGLTHPGDFLKAGFVFSRRRLDLELHAREALGGVLAGSLGLDPRQPFFLDARAHGSPKTGWFTLSSAVGAQVPATAQGRWTPDGGQASGTADLAASRWLIPWRDRLGPTATFTLAARHLGGDLYHAELTARGATLALAAAGQVDPGRWRTGPAGLALAVQTANLSTLAGFPGLGPARITGRLSGDTGKWRLLGEASLAKVQEAGFALASLGGPVDLAANRGDLTLRAQARGAGGVGTSPVAVLLGAAPRAAAEIDWLADGRILLRRLSIQGATLDLDGQGERSLFGGLSIKGAARVHDLARATPGAQGLVLADWHADQRSAAAPWSFGVSARGQALRLNGAIAEALLGPAPVFKAAGRLGRDGLTIDQAALDGAAGGLTGAGSASAGGDLRLRVEGQGKGPLRLGPVTATGDTRLMASVTGSWARPRLDGLIDFATVSLDGLPDGALHGARLALTAAGEADGMNGRVGLAAASSQGPVTAGGAFRLAGRRLDLTDLDAHGLGAAARGGVAFENGSPALADLTVSLDPGALLPRGHATGRARISGPLEARRVSLSIQGSGLTLPGGGGDLDALTLTADGPWGRLPYRIDLKGNLAGAPARFSGDGVLSGSAGAAGASFSGGGRLGTADIRTLTPVALSWRQGDLEGDLNLAVGQGQARVTLTRNAAGLSGRAVVAGLDLGLLDADLRGRADGVLTLARQGGGLMGEARARVSGLAARDGTGAKPFDGDVTAAFGGGAVTLGAHLADGAGSTLSGDVRLPAILSVAPLKLAIDTHRPLSGRFEIDGEVGPLWDFLGGGGPSLSGRLVAKGAIGGDLADPRLTGVARLDNGDFDDGGLGLRLRALSLRADLLGDAVDVAGFSATDGAKGSVTGAGRLSLVRDGASSFRLSLKAFRLFDTALGQAAASGTATVDRAADGKVRLGGALTIDHALISPRAAAPSGVVAMEVVEVHGPADAAPAVAAATSAEHAPPLTLDIGLKAPGGILIKGRGLNLEMSLDAHVSGTGASPVLAGVARVVHGDYDFAGQRFQMQDGGAVYLGTTAETVRLDLTASRDDPTLTAVIKIGGTAAAPTLTLSSTPALPKDEILSQVLFGASAAQLSGLQAAQLASAVAGLAGGGGLDVIGGLRNFAHLDRLAFDTAAATGVTVAGGKYLSNKVYVELTNGTRTGQGAQVEWRLKKHLSVVSRVTSQGDNAVSLRWRKDY